MAKRLNLTQANEWGQWHEGQTYDIRLGRSFWLNNEGTRVRVDVEIKEKATGKVHHRAGEGQMIGNFAPVWVSFLGKRETVEQILHW